MTKAINFDYDTIFNLYVRNNLSMLDISNKLHCSEGVIARNISRHHIPTKQPEHYRRNPKHFMIDRDELYNLYVIQGLRVIQIARMYHTDSMNVSYFLKLYSISLRVNQYLNKQNRTQLSIPKSTLIDLYINKRWSTRQIATKYGIGHQAILHIFKRLNIQSRTRKRPTIPKDVLNDLYTNQKLTSTQISKRYHCCPEVIRHMLHDYDIKVRTKVESQRILWADEEFRVKTLSVLMSALHTTPNNHEKQLSCILENLFPGKWKYVGNRKQFIGSRNPDFIHIGGEKKIIEFFGSYWHPIKDEQHRINYYKDYGYDTLIIWDKEMKDVATLYNKLNDFMEVKSARIAFA